MTAQESVGLEAELRGEHTQQLITKLKDSINATAELKALAEKTENDIKFQIGRYALAVRRTTFKKEEMDSFFAQPYYLYEVPRRDKKGEITGQVRKDAWYLLLPKWIDAQFGWLVKQTQSFNVFEVNRYMDWLGELPSELKKDMGWKDAPPLRVSGEWLTGPHDELVKAMQRYKPKDGPAYFKKLDPEKGILINPSRTFDLLAALVKDGILPFTPKPVAAEDLVDPPLIKEDGFEKRDYQTSAWKQFLKYSNVGVFFPPSTGKTWMGMYAMASLKGPHLVAVPSKVIQDQWKARLRIHTKLVEGQDWIVETYQSAIKHHGDGFKGKDGKVVPWTLFVVDEVHHMPADFFSKMVTVRAKYRMGLSATPFREDEREDFIFAFTGFPVGLSWEHFRNLGLIRKPMAHIWVTKTLDQKLRKIQELLHDNKRTVIFCDAIELGKTIAARFKIPHVWGDTKEDRIGLIDTAFKNEPYALVGSRVLDEGVSLPAIQRIIEIDWQGASRRQELQRYTRLLHSKEEEEGESHILMTEDEYVRDHDRFFGLFDKGFAVKVHLNEVEEEKLSKRIESGEVPVFKRGQTTSKVVTIQKEQTPESPKAAAENIVGTLEMPGMQKIMAKLTGSQRKFFEYLVKNDGTWFKADLPLFYGALGYNSYESLAHSVVPSKLIQMKLIEKSKQDGHIAYRTNMTSR